MNQVIGIDEAGRGCWAGPLVAAAVLLHEPVKGLNDSKKLSRLKRERLAQEIRLKASYGIAMVDAQEIDLIGLTAATQKAMRQAIAEIADSYHEVVIDGNINYLPDLPRVTVMPKADALIPAVSAASILAKVARDTYMYEIAEAHPIYQFERHVGYGTALHHRLLKEYGVCELHRLSYKPVQALLRGADD